MHSILSAALLSAALASARPMGSSSQSYSASYSAMPPYSTGSVASGNSTGPGFKFPLADGFPTPSAAQIAAIEKQAGGQLSNAGPPPKPHPDSLASLGFVAFNELFEVAFFTELVQNITTSVSGYGRSDIEDYEEVLTTLQAVVAQEQLHELNANGAFKAFTDQTILPCEYNFPVDNFQDAIALAATFTDVVLATLPDIQTIFAENGDDLLIRGVGSVIGQEGEQAGFYRHLLGKLPPALPFLTGGARDFAFNAILQNFVVPGSCPSQSLLEKSGLTEFKGVLNVLTTDLGLEDVTAKFSFETTNTVGQSFLQGGLYMTYINQQNVPFSVPINISTGGSGSSVEFSASFPGMTHDLNGLTIAAVTNSNGPFASPDDVAAATIFGPGLIEV